MTVSVVCVEIHSGLGTFYCYYIRCTLIFFRTYSHNSTRVNEMECVPNPCEFRLESAFYSGQLLTLGNNLWTEFA